MTGEIIHDHTGRIVPFGRVEQTLEHHFTHTGLPSWLKLAGGTGVLDHPGVSTRPGFKVTTTAAANATARVATTFSVRADIFEALLIEVTGMRTGSAANTEPRLEVASVSNGAAVAGNRMGVGTAMSAAQTKRYDWSANSQAMHNVGLLWLPRASVAYWLVDGQAVGRYDDPIPTYGGSQPVSFAAGVRTRNGAAQFATLSTIKITLWRSQ